MVDERDQNDLEARRFRAIASNTHDVITEVDARGMVVYRSPNDGAAAGRGAGHPVALDRLHPEDRKAVATVFMALFAEAHQVRATFRTLQDDGEIRWIECTGTSFETSDGERRAILLSRDISESRIMQERLRTSRERFQLIAENAYDMITELDRDGRVLYANRRVTEVLGASTKDQSPGGSEPSLIHPEDEPKLRAVFEEALAGGSPGPITFRVAHRSGAWRWLEASYRCASRADGGPRVVAIARDITERVENGRRLLESEERNRGLVEFSPLGIVVLQEGVIAFANPNGAEICGVTIPAALILTPMVDLVVP